MTADEVIKIIAEAFDGVERGDGTTIREGDVMDEYGSDEELDAARALDDEARWQDVQDVILLRYGNGLYFLDQKGFRYYLPAYMIWSLKNYKTSDSMFVNTPVYLLNPGQLYDKSSNSIPEKFKEFNSRERDAICDYLKFMLDSSEAGSVVSDAKTALYFWQHIPQEPNPA